MIAGSITYRQLNLYWYMYRYQQVPVPVPVQLVSVPTCTSTKFITGMVLGYRYFWRLTHVQNCENRVEYQTIHDIRPDNWNQKYVGVP